MPPNADGYNDMQDTSAPPTPQDGMDGQDGQDGDEQPMQEDEVCVSLDSLSMPDEKDKMQPPAVGDKVQLNIEGTVDRITGSDAYVKMSAVNGNPVEPDEEDEAEGNDGEAQQEASIRQDIGNLPPGY